MRKLIEMYKNMPPQMRMLAAAAGLGSFCTIVYTIDRFVTRELFGFKPPFAIVITSIGIAVLTALFYGSGKVVSKGFNLRSKKRGEKMLEDMSGDLGRGPVSMDAREAVKENNKKFFEEIREMRKQTKLSVYDLPWYIVIGDSGCGKTRLIEHSGLTFSRGRPEGYQLGTLNYNWWFTEDAIFIDMAGRLCNPQEDADHKEWQGFLNTVAKGRPACPINGAIVCISAEHLLEDTPEKIEGDANTMLERLRDLQNKLGVTFATYVVVTKCDKILGFMQFFDRAERDVEVRNQLVGWTRPAPFTDLFDPEIFHDEFEHLYQRLNELRVRRMNDDADEEELGMAYCLPEEFRELRDPLHTYLRVLFPPIKNPRAIKNLVFRGVYFTSSVQQGSVILKHLKERMGEEAGENIKPLEELYGKAKQKPLFIKHLLIRKVFPEYGLVFRNANEVARNKRYSRLLYVWSAVMAACLFGTMLYGISEFKGLIKDPRDFASAATQPVAQRGDNYGGVVEHVKKLGKGASDVEKSSLLKAFIAAPIDCALGGRSDVAKNLRTVQMGLYQGEVLPSILLHASGALKSRPLNAPKSYGPGPADSKPAQDEDFVGYKNALLAYCRWLAWSGTSSDGYYLPQSDSTGLDRLEKDLITLIEWNAATAANAGRLKNDKDGEDGARASFFTFLRQVNPDKDAPWVHPAVISMREQALSDQIAGDAIAKAGTYFKDHYAKLSGNHPSIVVRAWIARNAAGLDFLDGYEDFVKRILAKEISTIEELEKVKTDEFADPNSTLSKLRKKYNDATTAWSLSKGQGAPPELFKLNEALVAVRNTWVLFGEEVTRAVGSERSEKVKGALGVFGEYTGDKNTLDHALWEELKNQKLFINNPPPEFGADSLKNFTDKVVEYVSPSAREIIEVGANPGASQLVTATSQAKLLWVQLDRIQGIVANPARPFAMPGQQWRQKLEQLLVPEDPEEGWKTNWKDTEDLKSADVTAVERKVLKWKQQEEVTKCLLAMATRLETAAKSNWGLESVWSEAGNPAQGGGQGRGGGGGQVAPQQGNAKATRAGAAANGGAGNLEDRDWLGIDEHNKKKLSSATMDEVIEFASIVKDGISQLKDLQFEIEGKKPADDCIKQLDSSLQYYVSKYTEYWSNAYEAATLKTILALKEESDLEKLRNALEAKNSGVEDELKRKVQGVLHHICLSGRGLSWQEQPNVDLQNRKRIESRNQILENLEKIVGEQWKEKWKKDQPSDFIDKAFNAMSKDFDKNTPNQIVTELGTAWQDLVKEIQDAPEGVPITGEKLASEFERVRLKYGLDDEKLTQSVIDFANQAAVLITDQLGRDLCKAHKDLSAKVQYDKVKGWPYAANGGFVDAKSFHEFVSKVVQFEVELKKKGGQIPNKYQDYVTACKNWLEFLGTGPNNGLGSLSFSVTYEPDPPENVQGVQNCYNKLTLELPGGQALEIQTKAGKAVKNVAGTWDWNSNKEKVGLTLSDVVGGQRGVILDDPFRTTIGEFEGLGFWEFLRSHNGQQTITFQELGMGEGNKPRGLLFKFDFNGKKLPNPIRPPC